MSDTASTTAIAGVPRNARPWHKGLLGSLLAATVLGGAWLGFREQTRGPLAIVDVSASVGEARRFSRYEIQFHLNRDFENPFDPEEVDVHVEILAPGGARTTHPAFWDVPHRCLLDHGREVVRQTGNGCWKVRVSPMVVGRHRWTLTATTKSERASAGGEFLCVASDLPGFVRVCKTHPTCLEFSDGRYFYPIGHCLRSPVDDRWRACIPGSGPFAERYAKEGTFAYEEWFAKMRASGENFCAIWTAPWWCGLEWSPTQRGYEGKGRYNQRNAARLDRLVEMAEEHGVYILFYTMNHGMLSSAVDPEWRDHPYNQRNPGGMLEFASDFFESAEAQRLQRDRLRYIVARWGHSPAIAGWGITTEVDWFEAYHGQRSFDEKAALDGTTNAFGIPARRDVVLRWLKDTAEYLKSVDAHRHVVSTQVSQPTLGEDVWSVPEMEVVLTNAYTPIASDPSWQGAHWVGTKGVADALFVFAKKFEIYPKPNLVAEWGGTFLRNYQSHLAAELHTGLWASAMTNLAGATGFWWWNAVDMDNLYPHFLALSRFMQGEDRRGQGFDSERARVLMEFSPFSEGESPVYAPHPRQSALVLFNPDSLRGYVYCREINDPDYARPAAGFDDPTFPESGPCLLELPAGLSPGNYRVEYWNTFTGEPFRADTLIVAAEGARYLPLPSHRVDLAIKMDRVGE